MTSLAALINFWDSEELLPYTIKHIEPLVDEVIICYSDYSNYFEYQDNIKNIERFLNHKVSAIKCEPDRKLKPQDNERAKRNFALSITKERGHTHFIMMDADEIYEAEPFKREYKRIIDNDLNGLVCGSQVYFGKPSLTIGLDITRVPFIHKIKPGLKFVFNKEYPFAFDNGIKVDPTRQLNYVNGIEWSEIVMHHYSYVRKDIRKKIRNSTARLNIERSTVLNDLLLCSPGYFCQYYRKTLVSATVDFGICINSTTR